MYVQTIYREFLHQTKKEFIKYSIDKYNIPERHNRYSHLYYGPYLSLVSYRVSIEFSVDIVHKFEMFTFPKSR